MVPTNLATAVTGSVAHEAFERMASPSAQIDRWSDKGCIYEPKRRVETRGPKTQQETVRCLAASASNAKLYLGILIIHLLLLS